MVRDADKLKAIKELTEPFLNRTGRYWGIDIMLHKKHREYVNEIMWILEGSEFKENSEQAEKNKNVVS